MGLFAGNKTVRLYVKNGKIVKDETPDWFEVLETLPLEIGEKIKRRLSPGNMRILRDGSYSVDIANSVAVPIDILAEIIKGWSEDAPITEENIRKLDSKVVENLWLHLQKMYGITGGR